MPPFGAPRAASAPAKYRILKPRSNWSCSSGFWIAQPIWLSRNSLPKRFCRGWTESMPVPVDAPV